MYFKSIEMMDTVKNDFSIKDLENLSGVKAHTIRIWEKRYNILAPNRSETNIRNYNLECLQKLLNIALLHNHGYKISRIATLSEDEIPNLVHAIVSSESDKNKAINNFKIAMINFDQNLFLSTYEELIIEKTFREIFHDIFVPLLHEIGMLWQTKTITPAQEHFLSYLIKQKIVSNSEALQSNPPTRTDHVFVLYLPLNEIHELGLMYLNYELLVHGYKSVYLGESVPTADLIEVKKHFGKIIFLSYFTIKPDEEVIHDYINEVYNDVIEDGGHEYWILGRKTLQIDIKKIPSKIKIFQSIPEVIKQLEPIV